MPRFSFPYRDGLSEHLEAFAGRTMSMPLSSWEDKVGEFDLLLLILLDPYDTNC